MDIVAILSRRYNAEWTLEGDTYQGLQWLSSTPKPTENELLNLWDDVEAEIKAEKKEAEAKREALLERLGITEEEAKLLLG